MTLVLPDSLRSRLADLPKNIAGHVERVRPIARELANAHGIDADLAELTAAAHDVARHLPAHRLLEEAERLGLAVNSVERYAPVLLHGPVGAAWLEADKSVTNPEVLEGIRWHTTAHPDLAPVGRVVMLADKLDAHKAKAYPFQQEVRDAALGSLSEGLSVFLDGVLRQQLERGGTVHPMMIEARNALILATSC